MGAVLKSFLEKVRLAAVGATAMAGVAGFGAAAADDRAAAWRGYLDPPEEYAAFPRMVRRLAVHECADFDVEVYEQANGPRTVQRVFMAVPRRKAIAQCKRVSQCKAIAQCKDARVRLPAVVAPFYFPEAMLGFNPATGSLDCGYAPAGTNLAFYAAVAYMSDLARRGYVTASADAYYLTYPIRNAGGFSDWKKAGEALARDWPQWTGVGKLAFDTRLVVDLLVQDPRVDADRIGMVGHSLGGKMAFYAGMLDPRVKAVVASDFGMGWDRTNWGDVWYWGGKLSGARAAGLSHADLISLSNGKPFMLIAGEADGDSSLAIMRTAAGHPSLSGRLRFLNHATGHRPPRSATEEGYRFLDRWLRGAAASAP